MHLITTRIVQINRRQFVHFENENCSDITSLLKISDYLNCGIYKHRVIAKIDYPRNLKISLSYSLQLI